MHAVHVHVVARDPDDDSDDDNSDDDGEEKEDADEGVVQLRLCSLFIKIG